MNLQETLAKIQAQVWGSDTYEAEVEINDFPQHARWKAMHKENLGQISNFTGVAITTHGQYFLLGKQPGPTNRTQAVHVHRGAHGELDQEGSARDQETARRSGGGPVRPAHPA
jgi:hypothetical protein